MRKYVLHFPKLKAFSPPANLGYENIVVDSYSSP